MSAAPREGRWLALAFAATLPLVIAVVCERHLALDGVNFFIHALELGEAFLPTPSRVAADALTQLPLLAAARAGVTSLPVLVACYGLGVLLPFWFSLIAAWYALPAGQKHLMALPVWSLLALTFPVDGHLTHETHVLTPLIWPALFLVVRPQPWRGLNAALLIVLLGVLALSYESVCLVAPLLGALALGRAGCAVNRGQRALALGVAALALAVTSVGVVAILWPNDPSNRANFLESLRAPWRHEQPWIVAASAALFFAGWAWPRTRLQVAMGALLILGAGICLARRELPERGDSYQARTLTLTLMPAVVAVGAALAVARRPMPTTGWPTTVLAVAVLSAPFFGYLARWLDYRDEFALLLRERRGFVEVTGTKLERHGERNSWNTSELSLVWSADPVRAIIVNKPGEWPWEPFDPREALPLARYRALDPALPVRSRVLPP